MSGKRRTARGVVWRRPGRSGVSWTTGLALSVAMTAVLVPSAAVPAPVDDDAGVGVLGTSMVEMLGTDTGSGVVELEGLRALVLNDLSELGDGTGVDVALIDTGVSPVDGLDGTDKVLHGPDLSFEGVAPEVAHLDTYGHGTHMAGIIAGTRDGAQGIAPGARIVSLKVAGNDGVTTVPQVIAAIDWVVDHHDADGLNIRVLNLSLGQQGVTDHVGDLLSAAVERAWDAGIFVVVAAGNDGDTQDGLDSPAIDPYVLAVGAADTMSATDREHYDVPSWSARGVDDRHPDVVSAGRSIASYRVPGSTVDEAAPTARYGVDLFKGSGTSQAAATVSGAVAVMLSTSPALSNDDLKETLRHSADKLVDESGPTAGKGVIDPANGIRKPEDNNQEHTEADGAGSGIVTPTGATWSGGTWSGATWSGGTWSGATWSGATWSGATWSGATWSGATWSGATWSGATWSGTGWVN